jgi:hypothetical protein
VIDYVEIASRVLERWHVQVQPNPPQPVSRPKKVEQGANRPTELSAEPGTARREVWISWYEWKARELNRLFQNQGLTGQPGRITAETVRRGQGCTT